MSEEKAIQVSQATREMIETGAQAMIQQAIQYMQDAVNAPKLRRECEELRKQVAELTATHTELKTNFETTAFNLAACEEEKKQLQTSLHNTTESRDIIARHRDQLMSESSQMSEKLRKLRHSMDTMRGIMESNLAA